MVEWKYYKDWGCLRTGCWGEYSVLRGKKWQEARDDCTMRNFITCMLHQILLGWWNQGGLDGWGMKHTWRWEMPTKFWSEKSEGKRPPGRPRRRWEDNIRIDLTEIGWEGVNWMHLAQDRNRWRSLVKTVPCHEEILGEWRYSSTHSWPWH
jgi:hypothetical protein